MKGSLSPILRLIFLFRGQPDRYPSQQPAATPAFCKNKRSGVSLNDANHIRATPMFTNYEDFVQMTSGIDKHIFLAYSIWSSAGTSMINIYSQVITDDPETS